MIFLYILLAIITSFLFATLIVAVSNLFVFRSLKDYKTGPTNPPFVSILVPARNEEDVVGPCLKSLLAQDYANFEVLVLDDDSTDRTGQILSEIAAGDRRLALYKGTPLPEGWMGKQWACQQLSSKAKGELLLFTDADTVHEPVMLQQAVACVEKEKADLITALPRQIMDFFLDKLVMPFSYWATIAFLPLAIAYKNQNPLLSAGTGQFMLFRAQAYKQIGGFESVKQQVVDDVELCRRIRVEGLRWRILDGTDTYRVRQYQNYRELLEGFSKNLFSGFNSNVITFIFIWLWLLLISWAPVVCFILALSINAIPQMFTWLSAIAICMLFSTWLITYARFKLPLYHTILYPVIMLIMFLVAIYAMFLNLQRKTTWKGRQLTG